MKPQNFNSVQWSQRLRGYINLKTCLTLSAVTLTGAFVANLHAQGQGSVANETQPCCGGMSDQNKNDEGPNAISEAAQNQQPIGSSYGPGIFEGASVSKNRIGPKGIVLSADSLVPKDATLIGALIGPFVDSQTNRVVVDTVEINNASNRRLIKGAVYQMDVVVHSDTSNLFGLTLGSVTKTSDNPKIEETTPLRVSLSNAAKTIHLSGDIEAAALLQADSHWKVATAAQENKALLVAKKGIVTDNVDFRGAMRGRFVNLFESNDSKNRFVFGTFDALELGDHGLLATNYGLITKFNSVSAKATLYGAALGSHPRENLLRADADTSQNSLSLQGIIKGERFIKTGLSWGTSKTAFTIPNISAISDFGSDEARTLARPVGFTTLAELPPLSTSARVVTRANAQVAPPAATPAPTSAPAPTPTPKPMGSGGITIGGIPFPMTNPISLGSHFQIGADNKPVDSSVSYNTFSTGTLNGASGTTGSCVRDNTVYQEANIGYFYSASKAHDGNQNNDHDDDEALAADLKWTKQLLDQSANPEPQDSIGKAKEFEFKQEKGHINVSYHWTQNIAVTTGTVYVTYQRGGPTSSPVYIAKYEKPHPNPGDGDACPPTTPEPTPEDPEDPKFNGTPAPKNPTPSGDPTTATPAPVPSP